MKSDTRLLHVGRNPQDHRGVVNTPVYRASTVLYPTVREHQDSGTRRLEKYNLSYGIHGTPTHWTLEDAIADLEGGDRCFLVQSGLAAVTMPLMAFVKSGDHVLMVDSVYTPARRFCDTILKDFGVETTYYDPMIDPDGLRALMQPNTKVLYLESPGSITFEVQDVPALAAVGHENDAVVMIDNTWGVYTFDAFKHGCDVSIQAGTKYIVGHSDVLIGSITVKDKHWEQLKTRVAIIGAYAAPDDVYLATRGIRTMAVRLKRHEESALTVAAWLRDRPEVDDVLFPALPGAPGHDLWKRDFTGACGLFGVRLKPFSDEAVHNMIDGLELFGIGSSWGGFESLCIANKRDTIRTATEFDTSGPLIRIHIGLEDPEDLIADLEKGLARLTAAG
jgi:cystathionine beta-lyase